MSGPPFNLAYFLFQIEQRNDQGFPLKSKLFTTVIDDYTAYREQDHAHGRTNRGNVRGRSSV